MEVQKINEQIVCLHYDNQKDLAKAFLRFQEHYEGPKFRGEIFTLGQFRDWYSQTNGAFTYEQDWAGFNIPSYVLEPFINGMFDPLSPEEQEIVDLFRSRSDRFYVIGVYGKECDALDHETCHALYYTNDKYRAEVDKALAKHDLTEVRKWLLSNGYHKDVIEDECHAYISADSEFLDDRGIDHPESLHFTLRKILSKHFKE